MWGNPFHQPVHYGQPGMGIGNVPHPNQLWFQCQLAHGGRIGSIQGFGTIYEMHQKIARCFDLDTSEIMYCTRGTPYVEVDKIITDHIVSNDFIYAHLRGPTKQITVHREAEKYGVDLKDTGCGTVFIERIYPNGTFEYASFQYPGTIAVGDQIMAINGMSFVGARKQEVYSFLRGLPVGSPATLMLVSSRALVGASQLMMVQPAVPPQTLVIRQPAVQQPMYIQQQMVPQQQVLQPFTHGLRMMEKPESTELQAVKKILESKMKNKDGDLAKLVVKLANETQSPFDLSVHLCRQATVSVPIEVSLAAWNAVHPKDTRWK